MNEGKLLCFKLKPYNGGPGKSDFWCVPGGGVDEGESLEPALKREMIEETGITPIIGNLLYVQQFEFGDKEHLEFFFHITNAKDYLTIDLDKTTHGNTEVAEFDFIDTAASVVLPKFLTTESFTNIDTQPTKIFSYL